MRKTYVQFALGASAASLLLAGCSGGGTSSSGASLPALGGSQQFAVSGRVLDVTTGRLGLPAGVRIPSLAPFRTTPPGWMSPDAKKAPAKLFVTDGAANTIDIYNAAKPASPIGTITSGLNFPLGTFVDATENLYVANLSDNNVLVFPPGKTTPSKTLSNGVSGPIGVAVDAKGTVYIPEFGASSVVEFDKGATSVSRTISISSPEGVAIDSKGDLYVSYNNSSGTGAVEKFAPKATTGTDLGISVQFAGDVKLDKKNDLLFEDQIAGTVNYYKPGATSPYQTTTIGGDTYKLSLNKAETLLYVADAQNSKVDIVANKAGGGVVGTITGLSSCYGVSTTDPAPLY